MSDNTNPAYIKNRPFYDDTRTEYVVELNEYMHGFPISEKTLVAGETYDVEFGTPGKYEDMTWQSLQLTAKEFTATKNYVSAGISSGETLVYIGNLKAIDRGLTNTGEDFCIYTSRYGGAILRTLAASNAISYQISVGQTVADFKALDEKFIPKSIARAADIPKLEAIIAQATEAASTAASSARTHAEQAAQSAQEAKDAADRAGAAGGGGGYIASDEPPEDTRALWIDTSESGEAVALGATVMETEEGVKIYATDELGTTVEVVRHGRDGAPGAPGADGITPHIGDNGNWWIGAVDTGKPSRGADGKTPVKGTDYFTPAEAKEIARQAAGMVEVPGAGGGGTWKILTDITLTEDSAIATIQYDASLYRAMHARLRLPAVVEPIKLAGNFMLLTAYALYYDIIGKTDGAWMVDARIEVLGNDTMVYRYSRQLVGKNSWGNWTVQNDPDSKYAWLRCGGSAVLPAGTNLKVWGMPI